MKTWNHTKLKLGLVSPLVATLLVGGLAPTAHGTTGELPSHVATQTLSGTVYDIKGTNVNYPTQEEIKAYYTTNLISSAQSQSNTFKVEPSFSPTYQGGFLSDTSLRNGLQTANWIRYIAGIDFDLDMSVAYSQLAQDSSYVLALLNSGLTHSPTRPSQLADSSYDSLYNSGYKGASSSNIAMSTGSQANLYSMLVNQWMNDGDSSNIEVVGHRRWVLNPSMGAIGFGAVTSDNKTYGSMYAFDTSNTSASYTGVAWPAQNMPVSLFDSDFPWSFSVGKSVSTATVKLTRLNDGKVWDFSSKDKDKDGKYFNINNDGYGQVGCIVFRPDPDDISYQDGDMFLVEIDGAVTASYCVTFFDIDDVVEANRYLSPSSTPSSVTLSVGDDVLVEDDDEPEDDVVEEDLEADASGEVEPDDDEEFSLSRPTMTITVKEDQTLTTGVSSGVTWTSSNSSVAHVTSSGKVTGMAVGTATITATYNGEKQTCFVTVNATPSYVPVLSVSLNKQSLALDKGDSGSLTGTVSPSHATAHSMTWRSSDTTVATVDNTGKVTAVGGGTAIITATTQDGGKTDSCIVTVTAPLVSASDFSDVSTSHWFHAPVQFALEEGIMSGMGNNRFAPDEQTQRAMILTMLYSLAGKPSNDGVSGFSDVPSTAYYAQPIAWAKAEGIISGSGNYYPEANISREEICLILYKYAQTQTDWNTTSFPSATFSDSSAISSSASSAVAWCSYQGVVSGKNDNQFAPKDNATRAEIATMFQKFMTMEPKEGEEFQYENGYWVLESPTEDFKTWFLLFRPIDQDSFSIKGGYYASEYYMDAVAQGADMKSVGSGEVEVPFLDNKNLDLGKQTLSIFTADQGSSIIEYNDLRYRFVGETYEDLEEYIIEILK